MVFVSATPTAYEKEKSAQIVEQLIRPTGLIDPKVEVRPTKHQVDDLVNEIQVQVKKGQRTLVTTLTKRMSEDLTEYLKEINIKVQYLHSEIDTLTRLEILRDLRLGIFDVLVGINLLREGLDLPEVSLVAILDADKEGFLRNETSLVQTMGRAARHDEGRVIMYADRMTDSMIAAITETARRRNIQLKYNKINGITPTSIIKEIKDDRLAGAKKIETPLNTDHIDPKDLPSIIHEFNDKMELAAKNLEFEEAARLRDQIKQLENKAKEKKSGNDRFSVTTKKRFKPHV